MPYVHRLLPNRDVIHALIRRTFDGNVSDCARAAQIGPATLHDILSGRREGREETLMALAKALDVDLHVITNEAQAGAA